MTELRIRPVIRTDLAKHPAVRAWNDLGRSGALPEAVEVLKEARAKPDSRAVYRLAGVGPRGASVVAKRCGWNDAVHERTLYEQIIPRLPVSTVRYYGFVPDPTGRVAWLFLEDAGDDPYSPRLPAHRELAAKWLGLMHTRAAGVAGAIQLPERGLGWFRNRLQSARELLAEALNGSAVDGSEALKLDRLLRWCKATEERWPEIIASCDGMPSTLVHADFVGENVRVRNDDAGLTLLPFDWGTSGWGLPARDLVGVDIAVYHSIVQDYWPAMGEEDLRRLAAVGKLFRLIGAIHRACMSLPYAPVQKVLSDMRFLAVRA